MDSLGPTSTSLFLLVAALVVFAIPLALAYRRRSPRWALAAAIVWGLVAVVAGEAAAGLHWHFAGVFVSIAGTLLVVLGDLHDPKGERAASGQVFELSGTALAALPLLRMCLSLRADDYPVWQGGEMFSEMFNPHHVYPAAAALALLTAATALASRWSDPGRKAALLVLLFGQGSLYPGFRVWLHVSAFEFFSIPGGWQSSLRGLPVALSAAALVIALALLYAETRPRFRLRGPPKTRAVALGLPLAVMLAVYASSWQARAVAVRAYRESAPERSREVPEEVKLGRVSGLAVENGVLWGACELGLLRRPAGGKPQVIDSVQGRSTAGLRAMAAGTKGELWAAGDPGVLRIEGGQPRWVDQTVPRTRESVWRSGNISLDRNLPERAKALPSVFELAVGPEGELWLLLPSGIGRLGASGFERFGPSFGPRPRLQREGDAEVVPSAPAGFTGVKLCVDSRQWVWYADYDKLWVYRHGHWEWLNKTWPYHGFLGSGFAETPPGKLWFVACGTELCAVGAGVERYGMFMMQDRISALLPLKRGGFAMAGSYAVFLVLDGASRQIQSFPGVTSMAEGPDGEIYTGSIDGHIWKIEAATVKAAAERLRGPRPPTEGQLPPDPDLPIERMRELLRWFLLTHADAPRTAKGRRELLSLATSRMEHDDVRYNALLSVAELPVTSESLDAVRTLALERYGPMAGLAAGILHRWQSEPVAGAGKTR